MLEGLVREGEGVNPHRVSVRPRGASDQPLPGRRPAPPFPSPYKLPRDAPSAHSLDPGGIAVPKDPSLEVLSAEPFDAQPPLGKLLAGPVTPLELFFVCTHAPIPRVVEDDYRLEVGGMVERPLRLRLADLRANFPEVEVTATLQCAGNRREELIRVRPIPGEVPWGAQRHRQCRLAGRVARGAAPGGGAA